MLRPQIRSYRFSWTKKVHSTKELNSDLQVRARLQEHATTSSHRITSGIYPPTELRMTESEVNLKITRVEFESAKTCLTDLVCDCLQYSKCHVTVLNTANAA